jgi:glycine/D-amino acid oxidase-like deaminating enzyme
MALKGDHVDVAIIGGALMGGATAYFLSHDGHETPRILVLEKDPTFAKAASSRSTSGFRQQFSTPANIRLSQFSSAFILDAETRLGLPGEPVGMAIHESGYLLLGAAADVEAFRANNAMQRALGADVGLLDQGELRRRFPWMNVEDIVIGSLGVRGEGWFDGYLLMNAFRRNARKAGVAYRHDEVVNVRLDDSGLFYLDLAGGAVITATHVVNAAGTGAARIAGHLGLEIPVVARKQSVFAFKSPFRCEPMPYVFTPDGLFCRPDGQDYIAGIGITADGPDVDLDDMDPDLAVFDERLWPRLAHRVPRFEELRLKSAWAGHYDYCLFDQNPFIGPVEGVPNFWLATGFSGHGAMQSPGVGRALAELIRFGAYRTLDLADLAFDRLGRNRPAFEKIQY